MTRGSRSGLRGGRSRAPLSPIMSTSYGFLCLLSSGHTGSLKFVLIFSQNQDVEYSTPQAGNKVVITNRWYSSLLVTQQKATTGPESDIRSPTGSLAKADRESDGYLDPGKKANRH